MNIKKMSLPFSKVCQLENVVINLLLRFTVSNEFLTKIKYDTLTISEHFITTASIANTCYKPYIYIGTCQINKLL